MNIWLLHPSAGGPGVGRHWRPFWLADEWNRMDHRALVVGASFHHLMLGDSRPAGHTRITEVDYWFVSTPSYRGSGLGRLRNAYAFARQFACDADELARRFGAPDLIVASIPHLFHVSVARRVARRFGARFWVEVRDLWPESMVALGLAARWHPVVILTAMQERRAYRSAGRIISLLAGAEAYMRRRGLAEGRFAWIPNGVSQAEIRQAASPPMIEHPILQRIEDLRAQGRQVVIYAGAMGPPNAVEVIVEAARQLMLSHGRIHFVLIGKDIGLGRHRPPAAGLANLEYHDEVERPIAHAILGASDCAIIVFRRNRLYDHGVSPNKLFDYCLFAPRTVIACSAGALVGLEGLAGFRCEPGDPAALASSIVAALAAPARRPEERIAVAGRFSYSVLAAQYLASGCQVRAGGETHR